MTVYVDQPHTWNERFPNYCHMWTNGDVQELHDLAEKIDVKRSWFQKENSRFPHYDLSRNKRAMAIAYGAVEMSLMAYLREHPLKPLKAEVKS